jgi:hypothetical protein
LLPYSCCYNKLSWQQKWWEEGNSLSFSLSTTLLSWMFHLEQTQWGGGHSSPPFVALVATSTHDNDLSWWQH